MDDNSPFLELPWHCDEAVRWLLSCLSQAGMQVRRTFDLRSARAVEVDCPCPHHGTAQCACQMVVILVYQGSLGPISLLAHGHDQQTWITLVDNAEQPADPRLVEALYQVVLPTIPRVTFEENQANF